MKGRSLALRQARPDDVPRLRVIAEAAYALYVPRIGRRPAPMDEDFAASVAAGAATVAVLAGSVAGYVSARPKGRDMLLENVAVDPAFAGQGIGKALIAHIEATAIARGMTAVILYTNAAMEENLTLYPRLGYRQTGRKVELGFDRIYFRKDLA